MRTFPYCWLEIRPSMQNVIRSSKQKIVRKSYIPWESIIIARWFRNTPLYGRSSSIIKLKSHFSFPLISLVSLIEPINGYFVELIQFMVKQLISTSLLLQSNIYPTEIPKVSCHRELLSTCEEQEIIVTWKCCLFYWNVLLLSNTSYALSTLA